MPQATFVSNFHEVRVSSRRALRPALTNYRGKPGHFGLEVLMSGRSVLNGVALIQDR